jgi:hypothetical protein
MHPFRTGSPIEPTQRVLRNAESLRINHIPELQPEVLNATGGRVTNQPQVINAWPRPERELPESVLGF